MLTEIPLIVYICRHRKRSIPLSTCWLRRTDPVLRSACNRRV